MSHPRSRRIATTEEDNMGLDDKLKNKAQEAKGKAKEGAGAASDDQRLKNQGKDDQIKSNLKQAGENVKDAVKDR
jgi:uncharacterized protein YjbJ (UPF0337 family)